MRAISSAETDAFCPLGEMKPESPPPEVLAAASRLSARELASQESGTVTPALVDETPEATERLRSVFAFCDDSRKVHIGFTNDSPTVHNHGETMVNPW